MKVSKEQAAENRARVVEAASHLFRQHGFDGIGVDGLMQAAGLTHGGFYKNFASKDALAAEACGRAMEMSVEKWTGLMEAAGDDALTAFLADYLSVRHRDAPATGCVFSSLAADAARRPGPIRRAFTKGLGAAVDRLSAIVGGPSAAAKREAALATMAGMAGALMLSRAVDDAELSAEILAAARHVYGRI